MILPLLGLGAFVAAPATAAQVKVSTSDGLVQAAQRAKPGDVILLAPGDYRPNVSLRNLRGTALKPIILRAADPRRRPRFRGGIAAMHLSDIAYVELRDLIFTGASGNGLNIDDGGSYNTPSHHVTLANLLVRDVGPQGNTDGIKLSGVDDFKVLNCTVESWGSGGSGIDMVGCHRGVIRGCVFRRGGSNGIQMKGGSSGIVVRENFLQNAGERAIQIGGSTGMAYFRPSPRGYEAKDIRVEENIVMGSDAAVAFVGVDGAMVRRNTFYRPRHWAIRILQETRAPGFVPCRNGSLVANLIVWRSDEARTMVNVGSDTAPGTFRFARNFWYCVDNPARSAPDLPTPEAGGTTGMNPMLMNPERGDFRLKPGSPAKNRGAAAQKTHLLPLKDDLHALR